MLPVVAIVGRPNVGKSTLFNALTRTRDALVADHRARRFDLSRRACNRVLRVGRTIADLAQNERVSTEHIAEALSLRIDEH